MHHASKFNNHSLALQFQVGGGGGNKACTPIQQIGDDLILFIVLYVHLRASAPTARN